MLGVSLFGWFRTQAERRWKMESSKLLRSRRSSDNRKKRKRKEKSESAKRRRSRNARIANLQSPTWQFEKTDQKSTTQQDNSQAGATNQKETKKSEQANSPNETAERYQQHALYFYSKWKKAEEGNLPVIEESSLKELQTEIGREHYGICYLAKYGTRTVHGRQTLESLDT